MKERQLRVDKPRLRKKRPRPAEVAEAEIPAYEAMRKDGRLADRMLAILMRGVSTRKYREVLPEMAEQVGISKSQVSRQNIEAGERRRNHKLRNVQGHLPKDQHDQAAATLRAAWKLAAASFVETERNYRGIMG